MLLPGHFFKTPVNISSWGLFISSDIKTNTFTLTGLTLGSLNIVIEIG